MLSFRVYYLVQRDEVGTWEDSRGHSFPKELRLISSFHHLGNDMAIKAYTVLAKMKSCFEDLRSKTFQWEKKGLLSKKRTKKGPVIELLRTFSRYFHNIAKRS